MTYQQLLANNCLELKDHATDHDANLSISYATPHVKLFYRIILI